jgi:hypothetical protein
MTIHWKALGKHFLMVPLVVRFSFRGINAFSVFASENLSVLIELTKIYGLVCGYRRITAFLCTKHRAPFQHLETFLYTGHGFLFCAC